MRIIPAIDIIDGQCVRLTKGDYNTKLIYYKDPLDAAKMFEQHGIQYLHLVDLDGAKSSKIINHHILNKIAMQTSLKIDFGGGIKSDGDIRIAFDNGASQITAGSIAVKNPDLVKKWLDEYGSQKIILGADFNCRKIAIQGWGNLSDLDVVEFIQNFRNIGIEYVICTDIEKDGMLGGASDIIYREILEKLNIRLIASGGISSLADLKLMKDIGCDGAIVGKAIYEGKITLKELSELC
jgi:phosphoribosylformimino-5-aminoimidazole carboxamide ribotide isomerase